MDGNLGINTFPVFDKLKSESMSATNTPFNYDGKETKDYESKDEIIHSEHLKTASNEPILLWSDVKIEVKVHYYLTIVSLFLFKFRNGALLWSV